jgi:hypothetical protein
MDRKWPIALIIALMLPAIFSIVAIGDTELSIIKPIEYNLTFGNNTNKKTGQVNYPVCMRIDSKDNIYVLQQILYGKGKAYKSFISVYDKKFNHLRTFDIIKSSLSYDGLGEPATTYGKGFYYDMAASAFDIGKDGKIYVLSGYEIIIFDNSGKYRAQFSVTSSLKWIEDGGPGMSFVRPAGIVADEDGNIYTTTGNSIKERYLIVFTYDGTPLKKINMPANNTTAFFKDRLDNIYIVEGKTNNVYMYTDRMSGLKFFSLELNKTEYDRQLNYISMLSDGNFVASMDGIYIFNSDGKALERFSDGDINETFKFRRLVAPDSGDRIIIMAGVDNIKQTPAPLMTYRYNNNTKSIMGYNETNNIFSGCCMAPLAPLYLVYDSFLAILRAI